MPDKSKNSDTVRLLLRLGLAFVFFYAAISSLRQPIVWAVYLPNFLTKVVAATTLIKIVAIYELGLTGWLVVGKYLKYAALVSLVTLLGIIITNTSQFMTTFRDVGLAFMALALFFLER